MRKENNLPPELSAEIDNLIKFIKGHNSNFLLPSKEYTDISFIIRKSKWHRLNDKFVVIFFNNSDKKPFTIAKVISISNEVSIEKEYNSLKLVHDTFKDNHVLIPEPIALYTSDKTITYFEGVIDGIPFNDYQKLFISRKGIRNLHIQILEKCKKVLANLHLQKDILTQDEFFEYFHEPINNLNKTQFEKTYHSKLSELKEEIRALEKVPLPSVWMHGDFWLGSILYNSGKVGFIDWEFFSERGVPLWDYFSLIFHIGIRINYFTDSEIYNNVDAHLSELAVRCQLDKIYIPTLFGCFLLFNMHTRDTPTEKYWQTLLEYYWNTSDSTRNNAGRLL
jgi:hypothetical protein